LSQIETIDSISTTTTYQYDLNDRLEWEKINGIISTTYQYDLNGNTIQKTEGTQITNYQWNQQKQLIGVLTSVGREKVINAEWHKLVELPNQAIVTAATSELPNLASNPEHLKKFEQISKALDLRALQEMSRPSKYFQWDSW
jgi:YD repeat-containing protein